MIRRLGEWTAAIGLLLAAAFASPGDARPLSVDDLLRLSSVHGSYVSPDGRYALLQITASQRHAATFDNEEAAELSRQRLYWADLQGDGAALPVRSGAPGAGMIAGPFSPSGRRMAVLRYMHRRLQAGVLELGDRRVRWLDLHVLPSGMGRTLAWVSDTRWLVLAQEPGFDAERLRGGSPTHALLARLWRRTAAGRSSVTTLGSGRFLARDLPATAQLQSVDLATGRVRVLARGRFDDLEPSNTGRYAALTGWEEDAPLAVHKVLGFSDVTPRRRLTVVDLRSGRSLHPCPPCDLISTVLAWSPDADRLLIFARRPPNEAWDAAELLEIDPSAGPASILGRSGLGASLQTTVTSYGSEQLPQAFALWWRGRPLVFAHDPLNPARSDWWWIGDKSPVALTRTLVDPTSDLVADDADHLTVATGAGWFGVDARGRAWPQAAPPGSSAVRPPAPFADVRHILGPPAERSPVWALTPAPGRELLPAAGPADGLAHALRMGPEVESITPVGEGAIEVVRTPDGAVELRLMTGGRNRLLLRLNAWLEQVTSARQREVSRMDAAGATLHDWLYLPAASSGPPPPLIVLPYPGFTYASAPSVYGPGQALFYANAQLIAAHGYAALVPSLPPHPQSRDPAAAIPGDLRAAVDAAVATGLVDPHAIAVWGHSFGGYAALVAAEGDARYRAVIAGAGPTDLASLRGRFPQETRMRLEDTRRRECWMGWSEGGQAQLQASPWQEPGRYTANSPVFAADRITAPVLLLYGDQDFVGLEQGEEMFSALKRQDKDAELVSFWGEDHVISSPGNLKAYYATAFTFLGAAFTRAEDWTVQLQTGATRISPMPR